MQLFGQIAGLLDQGRDNTLPVLALDFGQHHKPGMALHEWIVRKAREIVGFVVS